MISEDVTLLLAMGEVLSEGFSSIRLTEETIHCLRGVR